MDGNAGGQLRRAAPGRRGPDGRLVAGEDDVAAEAAVGAERTLDDLQRGVVAAHGVDDDLHRESTSSFMVSRMASDRWLSSAFLLRLPLTRWSNGGIMPKFTFMG